MRSIVPATSDITRPPAALPRGFARGGPRAFLRRGSRGYLRSTSRGSCLAGGWHAARVSSSSVRGQYRPSRASALRLSRTRTSSSSRTSSGDQPATTRARQDWLTSRSSASRRPPSTVMRSLRAMPPSGSATRSASPQRSSAAVWRLTVEVSSPKASANCPMVMGPCVSIRLSSRYADRSRRSGSRSRRASTWCRESSISSRSSFSSTAPPAPFGAPLSRTCNPGTGGPLHGSACGQRLTTAGRCNMHDT